MANKIVVMEAKKPSKSIYQMKAEAIEFINNNQK